LTGQNKVKVKILSF